MANMYRKKLEKIYNKIDKIASKGRDNQLEYFKYINELIDKGDYTAFEEVLLIYYELDVSRNKDVDSYKRTSWEVIYQKTKSSFLSKLSKLYKQKKVYQSSFDIFNDISGELLGQIKEKVVLSGENSQYYIKNQQFARLIGERKTYLEVKKTSDSKYTLIDDDDLNISEENNLLNRYKTAIDYLLS